MPRAGPTDARGAQAHLGGQWFGVLQQGDGCVGVPARSPVRIHPAGSPTDNSHLESFNGKLRGECLNVSVSHTMEDARHILEPWRVMYNETQPHWSLGGMSPSEFAKAATSSQGAPALNSSIA